MDALVQSITFFMLMKKKEALSEMFFTGHHLSCPCSGSSPMNKRLTDLWVSPLASVRLAMTPPAQENSGNRVWVLNMKEIKRALS